MARKQDWTSRDYQPGHFTATWKESEDAEDIKKVLDGERESRLANIEFGPEQDQRQKSVEHFVQASSQIN